MAAAASPVTSGARARSRFAQHIHRGELISAASAVILLVVMFSLKWYGVDQPPGRANGAERVGATTAWHALTVVRWLMLLAIAVAIGALLLHLTQGSHGVSTNTNATVTVLGSLTAAVLTYRVLIDLPSPASVVDQKLGSYLGLLSAFGIAIGGYHSLREARAQSIVAPQPAHRARSESGD